MKKKPVKKTKKIVAKTNKEQFLKTVNMLEATLVEKEIVFNEDPKRFVEVVIKKEVTSVDLSSAWMIVERLLKKAGFKADEIEKYKEPNSYYTGLFLDIEKLRLAVRKEKDGTVYRRQPVLREKGHWIIKQAGEFRSVISIFNELTKVQGFNISLGTIRSYITEHKGDIDKLREDFKNELLSSNISVDSGRLKFWEEAYEFYYNRWKTDGKIGDFNACARILNEVRIEVKGDMVIKIDGKIDVNHTIEANKSLNQKLGELNVNMIVIGLAAQKANVNPLPLLTQLATSYYNKWNGVADKPLGLKDKDQLVQISSFIKNYNWDEIQQKNEAPFDMGTIQDAIIIDSEEEKKIVEDRKQKLLDLLRTSKKD